MRNPVRVGSGAGAFLVAGPHFQIPSGIPRRHRWPDSLGRGSFTAPITLPPEQDCPVIRMDVALPTILIGHRGAALLGSGDGEVAVAQKSALGLLPGRFRLESVEAPGSGAWPLMLAVVLTPAALERAFEDGKLWGPYLDMAARQPSPPQAAPPVGGILHLPSFATEGPSLQIVAPERLGEGILAFMGGLLYQWDFYRFLAVGPCRHLIGRPRGETPERFLWADERRERERARQAAAPCGKAGKPIGSGP